MESHLQHTHGRHFGDQDTLNAGGHHTGHDYNEDDQHHGEKKSVMKKVKEKAKKLKNTITKHGHGHGHGHDHHHHDEEDDDDDDDDEETVEDPEVHGAPMYDSAKVGQDAILGQHGGNLERPSVMAEDRYTDQGARHGAPLHASTGPYRTDLSEPFRVGEPIAFGQEVNSEKWRGKIGKSTAVEEVPFAPNPTRMTSPSTNLSHPTHVGNLGQSHGQGVNQGGLRGEIGKSTGMVADPHATYHPLRSGTDPPNYQTKVTDPTHRGGKEAEVSQIQHSFDKMGIAGEHHSGSDPKTFDPNHPEILPRESLTGNPSSGSNTYAEKISSSASAMADKAAVAKDVIASKLGYSSNIPSTESHNSGKKSGSATDYGHTITEKVTETLAPIYEKVVDAGSSVMSKVQGTASGTGQPEVQRQRRTDTSSGAVAVEKEKEADKGVSMKEYLVDTMRPGEEDKALSDVITHAFHRKDGEESDKKSGEDKPMGIVTESVEVRRRLGSDDHRQHNSSNVSAEKGVADRLRDAMGSWFGGEGNAPQGTLGTSYVTDKGLSNNPAGDRNMGSGGAGH